MPGVLHALEARFASPRGLLLLHRVQSLECVFANLLLSASFSCFMSKYMSRLEFVAWVWKIAVPLCANFLIMSPCVIIADLRCRRLVATLECNSQPILRPMHELLREGVGGCMRRFRIFFIFWYVSLMVWLYVMAPCNEFNMSWPLVESRESLPCKAIEAAGAFLICTNTVLMFGFLLAMDIMLHFPQNFAPSVRKHAFNSLLQQTSVHEYQFLQQDVATTCAICLTDFKGRDRVRRLPCKHLFHVECSDQWFLRALRCPYRCDSFVGIADSENQERDQSVATTLIIAL